MDIYDESGSVVGHAPDDWNRIGKSAYPKPLSEITYASKGTREERETIPPDIISRLRSFKDYWQFYPTMSEAADEIERLREKVADLETNRLLLREACLHAWPIIQYYSRMGQTVNATPSRLVCQDAYAKLQEALK